MRGNARMASDQHTLVMTSTCGRAEFDKLRRSQEGHSGLPVHMVESAVTNCPFRSTDVIG